MLLDDLIFGKIQQYLRNVTLIFVIAIVEARANTLGNENVVAECNRRVVIVVCCDCLWHPTICSIPK
jgi:hypothetical protein